MNGRYNFKEIPFMTANDLQKTARNKSVSKRESKTVSARGAKAKTSAHNAGKKPNTRAVQTADGKTVRKFSDTSELAAVGQVRGQKHARSVKGQTVCELAKAKTADLCKLSQRADFQLCKLRTSAQIVCEKKLAQLNYGIVGLGIMGGSFAKAIRKNILENEIAKSADTRERADACAVNGTAHNAQIAEVYDPARPKNVRDSANAQDVHERSAHTFSGMNARIRESVNFGKSREVVSGKIFALDVNEAVLKKAKKERIIDKGFGKKDAREMLRRCDVVFVCLYPKAALQFFETYANDFKTGTIATDISGIKGFLQKAVQKKACKYPFDFILGHPMAGGAKEGFSCARAEYFQNRNYILMRQSWNKQKNILLFKKIIFMLGFSRIVETDCKTHDKKIAFTSQLCHVIASALVQSAKDKKITEFGGGSFEDLTRIAMINAPLWSELFLENKTALLSHINTFQEQVAKIKTFVEKSDEHALSEYLREVRNKRIEMAKFMSYSEKA